MEPHEILGVSKTATPDEIKRAYRLLAKQHHPDKTGGDSTKFSEIQQAYDLLIKPKLSDDNLPEYQIFISLKNNYYGAVTTLNGKYYRLSPGLTPNTYKICSENNPDPIWLTVSILTEVGYSIKGIDLYTTVEVPESYVKREKEVTLSTHPQSYYGLDIRILKEAYDGCTMRVDGKGLRDGDEFGDLYITIKIKPSLMSRLKRKLFAS